MKQSLLKKALFLTLACASLAGTTLAAEPQEQAQLSQFILDEYVVTDSRVQTKLVDTPANISVVTQSQLENGNYTNVKEVLRDVPGVQLAQAGNSGANMGKDEIFINGDNRVLVLIDGRRMNLGGDGRYSANWLPPVEAIERIEVVKGASSAMYGSDAVGGVINILLKSGGDGKTTLKAGYGSFGTQDYTLSTGGKDKGWGYYVTYNHQQRGDFSYKNSLTGNIDSMEHSGYDSNMVILKLDKEIGKNQKITFNYEHMGINSEVPLDFYGNSTLDNSKRYSNNFALKYDWGLDTVKNGFVQIYQNYQHALFNSDNPNNVSNFNERTWGITAQQNIKTSDKNQLTIGLDWRHTNAENIGLFGGTKSMDNKALFIEDRWKFASSWQLNAGVRLDNHDKFGSKMTMHTALNKKFSENSNAYLSWGQVFKAPTAQDLYWNQPLYGMYGNPDLKPESGNVFTIGYNTKIVKTSIGVSAFYSDIKDAMAWGFDSSNRYTIMNINKEKRRGIELNLNHQFDSAWSVFANYTYVKVEQTAVSNLSYSASEKSKPNSYRFGLQYDKNAWTVAAVVRGASGQNLREYASSSYFTMDINAQYKIRKNVKVYVNVYNLNNAAYAESPGLYTGSSVNPDRAGTAQYPMPSRTIIGGVQVTF